MVCRVDRVDAFEGFLKEVLCYLAVHLLGVRLTRLRQFLTLNKITLRSIDGEIIVAVTMKSKGDTLYFIAYVTNKALKDVRGYNSLAAPYTIHRTEAGLP